MLEPLLSTRAAGAGAMSDEPQQHPLRGDAADELDDVEEYADGGAYGGGGGERAAPRPRAPWRRVHGGMHATLSGQISSASVRASDDGRFEIGGGLLGTGWLGDETAPDDPPPPPTLTSRTPFATGAAGGVSRGGGAGGGAGGASQPMHVTRSTLRGLAFVGQIERKFVAATAAGMLFLLDQHAADERVQLEKLLRATVDESGMPVPSGVEPRRLRPAARLAPTTHELALLSRHAARIRAWGWELREAGAGLVGLEGVPTVQGVELGAPALREYAEALEATGGGSTLAPPAVLRVLASKACRRSVMFGDALTPRRCQQLLDELARCEMPFQCAHGRPTLTPVLALDALPGGWDGGSDERGES
jgi:hypothetical protein